MSLYEDIELKVFPAGENDGIRAKFTTFKDKDGKSQAHTHGKYGSLDFHLHCLDDHTILTIRFVILEKVRFRITASVACTFFWAALRNDFHYSINNEAELELKEGHFNFCHMPDTNWEFNFSKPGEYETFHLIHSRTGLEEWMRTYPLPNLQEFKDKVDRGEMTVLLTEPRRLPQEAGMSIVDLIRGPD